MGGRSRIVLSAAALCVAVVLWLALGPWSAGERAPNRETATPPERTRAQPLVPDDAQTPALPHAPEQEPESDEATVPLQQQVVSLRTGIIVSPILGRIRGPDGQHVSGARVLIRPAHQRPELQSPMESSEDGSFLVQAIVRAADDTLRWPDVELELLVWWPERRGYPRLGPDLRKVFSEPGELGQIMLPPQAPDDARGHVYGLVLQSSGQPAYRKAFARIWVDGEPEWTERVELDREGRFRFPMLEAGDYRLEVHCDGYPTLHMKEIVVRAGVELDLGVLRFPPAADIRVDVFDLHGERVRDAVVEVQSADQRIRYNVRKGLSEVLNAGRYLVLAGAPGQTRLVELHEGEHLDLRIEMQPTGAASFEFVREGGDPPGDLEFEVLDRADRRIRSGQIPTEVSLLHLDLIAGVYRIRVRDAGGFRSEAAFPVEAGKRSATERILLRRPDPG